MRLSEIEENKPAGIYVGVKFSDATNQNLAAYQAQHGIPSPTPPDKFHITILYSRNYVPWQPKSDLDVVVTPEHSELAVFGPRDGGASCLVWKLDSEYLTQRFELGMEMGATFDFDSYKPHITLSYDIGDFDYKALPLPTFNVEIVSEFASPLDEDWGES